MANKKKPASKPKKPSQLSPKDTGQGEPRLYTLEVILTDGPISEKFAKKNPVISRTIQIRGDQTLEDLHNIIFDVYDPAPLFQENTHGKRI
ncbi:MAG TPA: hypothetical protein VFC78_13940 [Tepidisphaeraceae bacterium]|nr:hypothetical protein [Tepidisphaeraceae bacterium]